MSRTPAKRSSQRGLAATPDHTPSGAADPRDPGTGPLRVLALEDDADTREVLSELLCAEEGFLLDVCGEVAHCLQRLRAETAAGRAYDALLLDLMLPEGHAGTEVIEVARRDPQLHLPGVVAFTALSGSYLAAHEVALMSVGAQIIAKPFDADALMRALRTAAGR